MGFADRARSPEERLAEVQSIVSTAAGLPPENALRYLRANQVGAADLLYSESDSPKVDAAKAALRDTLEKTMGSTYTEFVRLIQADAAPVQKNNDRRPELRSVPKADGSPERQEVRKPGLANEKLKQDMQAVIEAYINARNDKEVPVAFARLARETGINVNAALAAIAEERIMAQMDLMVPAGLKNAKEYIGTF